MRFAKLLIMCLALIAALINGCATAKSPSSSQPATTGAGSMGASDTTSTMPPPGGGVSDTTAPH
jgi:hypothetical protein